MEKEEFWSKLDAAVSETDPEKATEAVVAALQQGYEENQELLCAVVPDPYDRNSVKQLFLPIDDHRYFILFTQFDHFLEFSRIPGISAAFPGNQLSLQGLSCREVLDDVVRREVIGGIVFNPKGPLSKIKGFPVSKSLLPFVQPKPKAKPKIVHHNKRKKKR